MSRNLNKQKYRDNKQEIPPKDQTFWSWLHKEKHDWYKGSKHLNKDQVKEMYEDWIARDKPNIRDNLRDVDPETVMFAVKQQLWGPGLQDMMWSLRPHHKTDELVKTIVAAMKATDDPRVWDCCAMGLAWMQADEAMPEIEALLFDPKTMLDNATLAYALQVANWTLQSPDEAVDDLWNRAEDVLLVNALAELLKTKYGADVFDA